MGIYGHAFDISFDDLMLSEGSFIDSLPDISPEEINKYCIQRESTILTEAQVDQILMEGGDLSQEIGKLFSQFIISGVNMGAVIKKTATNITNIIKSKGVSSESREKIRSEMQAFWANMDKALSSAEIKDLDNKKFAGLDKNGIKKSFILLYWGAIVSTLVCLICLLLFGDAGMGVGATIAGPLVEENCKKIAIKGGYIKEYTIIFNTYEASSYILQIMSNPLTKFSFGVAFKIRMFAVGMHLTTTIIQWLTSNPEILKKFNIESEDDKAKASVIGHTIALIIHGVWNGLAGFSKTFNNILMNAAGAGKLYI